MLPKSTYDKLLQARKLEKLQLKPCKFVKEGVVPRNYQAIGVYHVITVLRIIIGDDTGLGKTLQTLLAYAYLKEHNPKLKLLVVASKSALYQWLAESQKFLTGISGEVVASGGIKRMLQPDDWVKLSNLKYFEPRPKKKKADKVEGEPDVDEDTTPIEITYEQAVERLKRKKTVQFSVLHADQGELGGTVQRMHPIDNRPLKVEITGSYSRRVQFKKCFEKDTDIIVMNYNTLVSEYEWLLGTGVHVPSGRKLGEYMVIFDEATYFKNRKSHTHRAASAVSYAGVRAVGLTATVIKNRLEEAFSIFLAICPGLFKNVTEFRKKYMNHILIPMGGRKIPKLIGYKNLWHFRETIDQNFIGRKKGEVAKELPPLISKEIPLQMTDTQEQLYLSALEGLIVLDSGEEKEIERLAQLSYCQQISNSPHTIGVTGDSSKEERLFDDLDNDLDGEKVIVYSRYKKMIDRLTELCNKRKIKTTRITGDEDAKQRSENQAAFQNDESGVNVIFINSAGSESINLQKAGHFIFFDLPWSFGDYMQLVGRAQRIGSEHEKIIVHHYINQGTIDEHVLKVLKSKKGLVTSIFGEEGSTGELDFDTENGMAKLIFDSVVADAKMKVEQEA
jgi:SNF2 family DNA or RNA helicase